MYVEKDELIILPQHTPTQTQPTYITFVVRPEHITKSYIKDSSLHTQICNAYLAALAL